MTDRETVRNVAELDPIYFSGHSWIDRLDSWLQSNQPISRDFYLANKQTISASILGSATALNMAVNIPAHALLGFIADKTYKNTYERKREIGSDPGDKVNSRRQRVDTALFGVEASKFYFGALALGGTGVRFYGEYCMILRHDTVPPDTKLMDRNSWDIEFPPLDGFDKAAVVASLKGTWSADAVAMATLKVIPQIRESVRLMTAGQVSEAILHDESFIEVHKRESFKPSDLHEIRESPVDAAIESQIVHRFERAAPPTLEEAIWVTRRVHVSYKLADSAIRSRFVASSGRERS